QGCKFDLKLISAFVERWRPERHTFHLPCRECTITLEDVQLQLGLLVDGSVLTGSAQSADWGAICYDLLGVISDIIYGSWIDMGWLRETFPVDPWQAIFALGRGETSTNLCRKGTTGPFKSKDKRWRGEPITAPTQSPTPIEQAMMLIPQPLQIMQEADPKQPQPRPEVEPRRNPERNCRPPPSATDSDQHTH
ncbi:hypothetical protein Gotur_013839, partial [Gossypium turneri]